MLIVSVALSVRAQPLRAACHSACTRCPAGLPFNRLTSAVPTTVFWKANAVDAWGNIIDETLGNGVQTVRGFDLAVGVLDFGQVAGQVAPDARQVGKVRRQHDLVGIGRGLGSTCVPGMVRIAEAEPEEPGLILRRRGEAWDQDSSGRARRQITTAGPAGIIGRPREERIR